MVSRRNYLAITAVMLVVFFLFQFTNVALESWNDYKNNSYAVDRESLPPESGAYTAGTEGKADLEGIPGGRIAVFIGSEEDPVGRVVNTWAVYGKKKIKTYGTVEEYKKNKKRDGTDDARMVVIDPDALDWERKETVEGINGLVRPGVSIVFTGLPDVSVIEGNRRLMDILGIRGVREKETFVTGLHLYQGFLLGGEMVYRAADEEEYSRRQDMEFTFPWFTLKEGTKAYMRGIGENDEEKEEDGPAVIWRNRLGGASVFAVNGGYMEDAAGIGILSAMCAQSGDHLIYPVVNAQNMIFTGYPGLARENSKEMMERYGHTLPEMLRNNAWPAIVAVSNRSPMGLSSMLSPQYDYEDSNYPDQAEFLYHMKRLNEQNGEVGLSGVSVSPTPVKKKLLEDARLMEDTIPEYRFASFYGGGLGDDEISKALESGFLDKVRTVVTDYDGGSQVIGYQSEHVTRQQIVSDGTRHTFMEDFRVRSLETALAYTSTAADISRAAFPEGEEDTFEKVISDFGWNIQHYWEPFKDFAGTTVSDCDERIRRFLALDYREIEENGAIRLELEWTPTPVWFILRSDGRDVDRVEGGRVKKLEDGAWLLEADELMVTIRMK